MVRSSLRWCREHRAVSCLHHPRGFHPLPHLRVLLVPDARETKDWFSFFRMGRGDQQGFVALEGTGRCVAAFSLSFATMRHLLPPSTSCVSRGGAPSHPAPCQFWDRGPPIRTGTLSLPCPQLPRGSVSLTLEQEMAP